MRRHALLLPVLLCLPLAGQSKGKAAAKPAPKKPAAASVLWKGVFLESTAYEGEVKTDLEVFSEDDIILDADIRVDPRPTRVAWRTRGESEREAKIMFMLLDADRILEPMGLVRITNEDLAQYRRAYHNFPDLGFISQSGLIYRPKNEERFKQLLEKVRLIGDRQRGRMLAHVGQLFVVLEPRDFVFVQKDAKFSVRISTVLYAGHAYQGERPEGGPLQEFVKSTLPLISEVRGKFLTESRLLMKPKAAPTSPDQRPQASKD
jgi:hypothetical protein